MAPESQITSLVRTSRLRRVSSMGMTDRRSIQKPSLDSACGNGLLVYIPCYTDFEMAKRQAMNLRRQFELLDSQQKNYVNKLSIIISVNAVKLTEAQLESLESVCDELIYTSIDIGADANIAQGFLKATQKSSEFFWILSTNDELGTGAINDILNTFLTNLDCDLVVADESKVSRIIDVSNVIYEPISGLHFGLISAVIYRSKKVNSNFPTALKLSWTGWGQLGVIQTACFTNKYLRVATIPKNALFSEMGADRLHESDELRRNGKYYSHSFFGMPLLISSLFAGDRKLKRKFLNSWLFSNWYKISLFSSQPQNYDQSNGINEPYWRQSLVEDLIKANGILPKVLYFIGKTIDWQIFKDVRIAQVIRKWI